MRDPLQRIPVRYKLAAVVVALYLLAWGIGGSFVLSAVKDALGHEIHGRIDLHSRTFATALDAQLRMLLRRAEDFASDGYVRSHVESLSAASSVSDREQVSAELRQHLLLNKLPLVDAFAALDVVSVEGSPIAMTAAVMPAATLAAVQRSAKDDVSTCTDFIQDPDAGGPLSIALIAPLRSLDSSRLMGRLVARVRPAAWVATAIRDAGLPERPEDQVKLRLLDRSGAVVRVASALSGPNAPNPGSDIVKAGFGLVVEPLDASGTDDGGRIVRTTYPISINGWTAEIVRDASSDLAAVGSLEGRFVAAGIVLAIAAGLLLWFPIRFLAAPLARLGDAARRIKEGDFTARAPVEGTDEIGELARSFNLMAEAVMERTSRLEHAAEDLTARQAELRRESDRLAAVISSMRDGLVVLDADGHPVLSNGAARPLLELISRQREATGHHLCRDESRNSGCRDCLSDVASPPLNCVVDIAGGVYEVHTATLAPDSKGRSGRVLVSRDVSDRVTQDERQIHQERLAVLGEVAAVMAHELNNPLAACSMFSQMLDAELGASSPVKEHTEVIRRNLETCKRTIRELLDYATGSTPEVGAVAVDAVLEDVARFLRPVRERAGVELALSLGADGVDVSGDEVQVRQVFVNLVVNAIQAIGQRHGTVTVTSRAAGDFVEIDIQDTGGGIPTETRDLVFKPFFTTKPRGEGTGLGLPTARRIAEMHGGGVDLLATGPTGTTFRVRLRRRAGVAV